MGAEGRQRRREGRAAWEWVCHAYAPFQPCLVWMVPPFTRDSLHLLPLHARPSPPNPTTPSHQVPKIFWDFTSTKVLTMEYCPGIKISDVEKIERAGIDRKVLAKRSAESYLTQLCRYASAAHVSVGPDRQRGGGFQGHLNQQSPSRAAARARTFICLHCRWPHPFRPSPAAGMGSSTATRTRATWRATGRKAGDSSTTTSA